MRKLYWGELTTKEFEGLDAETTIAVLPVAAIEQHGPHLAVSTDTVIANGMIGEVVRRLPDDLNVLILPTQAIGKSNEHLRSPGTITLSAETALRTWVEVGEGGPPRRLEEARHGQFARRQRRRHRHRGARAARQATTCWWSLAPGAASACRPTSTATRRLPSASMPATSRRR